MRDSSVRRCRFSRRSGEGRGERATLTVARRGPIHHGRSRAESESRDDRSQDRSRFRGARVDRALRSRGRAEGPQSSSLSFRSNQRAQVPQAARRGRRDRPGNGQSHRPARGLGDRQALRGRPRLHATTATVPRPAFTTCAARSPIATNRGSASASIRTRKSSPPSAPRRDSATCAWLSWGRAIPHLCPRRAFRSIFTPSRWRLPT